jgi:hypothetical protein
MVLLLALAGCHTGAPLALQPCPPGMAAPKVPGPPRNIETLANYANALRTALTATEAARAECAQQVAHAIETLGAPPK